MANHVNTYVSFNKISDAGLQRLKEIMARIRTDGNYRWFADIFVDGRENSPTYEQTELYEWTIENIGPKWCYVEDYDESDYISLTSAWSYPEEGLDWLAKEIGKVDPDLVMTVTYEDEMPNFFGASIFGAEGHEDSLYWDYEELIEELHQEHPEMKDHWDEDEQEGDDEYWDMFNEFAYEKIHELQEGGIDQLLEQE